ncbi:MAG: hypothetical protein KGJ02_04965 [Verrucomicrobiota bacterium]|nr:hypothetical protein [Verrucomicrobiota bacterium]
MSIETVDSDLDYSELGYSLNEIDPNEEGSDNQRTYTLLKSGEYCHECHKNFRMRELGIEKISFRVYQIAGIKFFDMNFNVSVSGGKTACLHFSKRVLSTSGSIEFFAEMKKAAAAAGAVGLIALANQAAILASQGQLPPNKDSQYFRCMESCERIEFEPFKLLCYITCTIWADQTPGS